MNLDKNNIAQIRAAAYGLNTAETQNFEASVTARLQKLLDGGTVKHVNKNHIKAACAAELASGK